jgi:two-component system, CAI-1 autoinducer sensor kinase/phosphatase CqsS
MKFTYPEFTLSRARSWLVQEVLEAPLVAVLHPSPLRVKGLGLFTVAGHPLFWWIWSEWLPQPYENLWLRLATGALGFLLLIPAVYNKPSSRLAGRVFSGVIWFELPFVFNWMYLCNGGNAPWLASMGVMILIYYFVTDWRIATVGLLLATALAGILFRLWGPVVPEMQTQLLLTNGFVLVFCVCMGLLLGVSSANLRREQLAHTLTTMGIMAHELRTPLATITLIGDALKGDWGYAEDPRKLAQRLHLLVRNMNRQIDMQIANAQLMRLTGHKNVVSAAELVADVVAQYPYRGDREREVVQVRVHEDFRFAGSRDLFSQVLENLIKNALRSLAAASSASEPGDLRIEIGLHENKGRLVITDRGVGIAPVFQTRIFEPFFSTSSGTGHGLGLAFCQQVITGAHGTIRVKSELGRGAIFTVQLPRLD